MKRLQSLGAGAEPLHGTELAPACSEPERLRRTWRRAVLDATDLSIVTEPEPRRPCSGTTRSTSWALIATFVVAPDELMIRDHIQAVAQHNGDGNGNGNGNSQPHAMIVHADGTVGSSLAVTVERAQPSVATVVVEVDPQATEPRRSTGRRRAGPGTAAVVQQINRGVLAESEVGVALFHARTCRLVAGNDAYLRLAKSQHRRLLRTLTGGIAVAVDDDDARSIHAVRRGELGCYAGPAETPDATRGRYLVCGLGTAGVAPTYLTVPYPAGSAPKPARLIDFGPSRRRGRARIPAAIVDDEWRLRLIPRYSCALNPKELGELSSRSSIP